MSIKAYPKVIKGQYSKIRLFKDFRQERYSYQKSSLKQKNGFSLPKLKGFFVITLKDQKFFQMFSKIQHGSLNAYRKIVLQQFQELRLAQTIFNKNGKQHLIQFFYTLLTSSDTINDLYYCFLSDSYGYSHLNVNYLLPTQTNILTPNYTLVLPNRKETISLSPNKDTLIQLKTQVSQNIELINEVSPSQRTSAPSSRAPYKKCKKLGIDEIKLDFRTQWKNQNRNIVPNLVNQMMSFILKKNKSSKLINRLFKHYPHASSWNPNKFYLYMKKIKDSVSHYVNQSIIQYFFQIHEPKCEIYQEEEQQFYMKLCRIAILSFLRSDVIIISLTSSRMSEAKRKTHLIARQALLNKFLQLARH